VDWLDRCDIAASKVDRILKIALVSIESITCWPISRVLIDISHSREHSNCRPLFGFLHLAISSLVDITIIITWIVLSKFIGSLAFWFVVAYLVTGIFKIREAISYANLSGFLEYHLK